MTASKSRAVVLHVVRQGETNLVVQVVDSVCGRRSLLLRGAGKGRFAAATAALHPMSVIDLVTYDTPYGSLRCIREFEPVFALNGIRGSISKSTMAIFLAEVLYRGIREGDGGSDFFNFLVESVVRLDAAGGNAANFHLWWMAGFCGRMGFAISPQGLSDAGIVPGSEEFRYLLDFARLPLDEVLAMPLGASSRTALAAAMISYLSRHLGCSLDIRSLDVLHSVFR